MTYDEVAEYLADIDQLEWSKKIDRMYSLLEGDGYMQHINAPAVQKWTSRNAAAVLAWSDPEFALRQHYIATQLSRPARKLVRLWDDWKMYLERRRYERLRAARKRKE